MLAVEGLDIQAGAFALRNISFRVASGRYAVLMGRTGSGKTTLLEALCGLRPIARGRIQVNGVDVTDFPPRARGLGYVPQDLALFSTHSVREHLAFALRIRCWPLADIERRVGELAEWLRLGPHLDRRPATLSGGEKQRVALGRALACRPGTLLLDEPLSALDEETRAETCALLTTVRQTTGATVLHVTHNLREARLLGDEILTLREGVCASRPTAPDEAQASEDFH